MKKRVIKFRLDTLSDFSNRKLVEKVLYYLMELPRAFRPRKYGTYEPLRSRITNGEIEPLIDGWIGVDDPSLHEEFRNTVFFMDTASQGSYMVVWGSNGFSTLSGRFSFPARDIEQSASLLLEEVDHLACLLSPEYGYVHDPSSRGGRIPYDLTVRLPDIPPISILGPKYIEFFGDQRLEQAPYLVVSKRSYGYWLEASESIFDDVSDNRRKAIREFLGEDCFMAIPKQRYKKGRAPNFHPCQEKQS